MTYTPGFQGLPTLPLNTEVPSGRQVKGEDTFLKYVEFIGLVPASSTKTIAHGITGLDRIIHFWGSITTDDDDQMPLPFASPFANIGVQLQADATNVRVLPGSFWTGAGNLLEDPKIVIEYTKT